MRKMSKRDGDPPVLTRGLLGALLPSLTFPDYAEQMANLLMYIGDKTMPGENVTVRASKARAIIGAASLTGMEFALHSLRNSGLVNHTVESPGEDLEWHAALTYKGWEHYSSLRRGEVNSRKAFMAMQYGDPELDSRGR